MTTVEEHNFPSSPHPTPKNTLSIAKKSSSGPKTQAGKRRVRLNAIKDGFYSNELIVNENEKPEFEALRTELKQQLCPSTVVQQVAFEKIICCTWRLKLATRMETRRLKPQFGPEAQQELLTKGLDKKPEVLRWYAFGRADLQFAVKLLVRLREEIETRHSLEEERWKEPLTKVFGVEFYDSLSNWRPRNYEAILLAEQLVGHAEAFKRPLPGFEQGKKKKTRRAVIDDHRSRLEMMLKLIDRELEHVSAVRVLLDQRTSEMDSQSAAGLDVVGRFFTTASRDLERATAWYQEVKEQRL